MGYKVNESHIAYRLNYHYAMYKGYPVYLMAEGTVSSSAEWGDRSYSMQAYKVGESNPIKFHVDVEEPTFSAAATQAGYCFDGSGRLAYLHCTCGALSAGWSISTDFSTPSYNTKKLYDCLIGNHPTFAEALKTVSVIPRKKACSFDRHFALVRESSFDDISIHYKGKTIGYYDVKNLRLKLRSGPTVKLLKRKLEKLME